MQLMRWGCARRSPESLPSPVIDLAIFPLLSFVCDPWGTNAVTDRSTCPALWLDDLGCGRNGGGVNTEALVILQAVQTPLMYL